MSSPPAPPSSEKRPTATAWALAAKVTGSYAVLSAVWIILSDLALSRQPGFPLHLLRWELAKGLEFVVVTSLLLLLLVRHFIRTLQKAESLRWAGEPQFRSLVEQSLVGVYLIQDERFVYVNPRLAEIFGYSPAEIMERKVEELVAIADRARVRENVMRRLSGGLVGLNYSFRGLHRGGWPLQLEVFGSRTEHRGNPAIIGTLLDVTDREEAETALRESEMRYRLLIETAPEAIVVLDMEHGRFVDHNAQAERLFEMPGEELGLHGPLQLSPEFQPDGRRSDESLATYVAEAIGGGMPAFEWVHRSRSGREIWCDIRLGQLPAQGRTLLRESITDITERRRTARALVQSQEDYRLLFEQATDAIFLCDAAFRLVDVNQRAISLTGFTREQLLQMDAFGVVDSQDHGALRECLRLLAVKGTAFATYHFSRRDAPSLLVETSTKLLPDRRILVMARDITERQQAEEHRNKLEEELRQAQKLQAIGTLAGGIAHDFNNILAAILGNAQLLKRLLPSEHEGQGKVSQILLASNRAKDLVQQILTFSRQREQEWRVLQMGPVVTEAVRLIEVTLPPSIELRVNAPDKLPTVKADASQIHQVVVNLCTNALHAMRQAGGTLRLELSAVSLPEGNESMPPLPAGQYVCLQVSDTGHGMDAATLERIYEPFFTTKSIGDGTGLGLAVVHGIVQAHNGGISVSSAPGRGTTFSLYFPADTKTVVIEPKPAAPSLKMGRNQHVLFIDDEVPIAEVARLMLPQLGYDVTVFTNPRQALEHFRENHATIDLLMSDLSMPDLSGVDLIREAIRLKPHLPTVLLTGYGRAFETRAAVALNIREVINKPFTMETLAVAIHNALETPGAKSQ